MEKILSFVLAAVLLVACGNHDSNEDTNVKSAPVTPGIDNVNGNIPDTSETIRLNGSLPVDSTTGSAADTVSRR